MARDCIAKFASNSSFGCPQNSISPDMALCAVRCIECGCFAENHAGGTHTDPLLVTGGLVEKS